MAASYEIKILISEISSLLIVHQTILPVFKPYDLEPDYVLHKGNL
jgi:hypothetical protein